MKDPMQLNDRWEGTSLRGVENRQIPWEVIIPIALLGLATILCYWK